MIEKESIPKLNKAAKETFKDSGHDRNFIHLFRPHDNNKLNIVGSFEDSIRRENPNSTEEDKSENIAVLYPEFSAGSKNSFGMIATMDFPDYRDIALGIGIEDKDNFYRSKEAFLKELKNADKMFCIDKNSDDNTYPLNYTYTYEQYRKALYARCLLANIWCFGIDFYDIDKGLLNELKESKQVYINDKTKDVTRIYGRPSDDLIDKFSTVKCKIGSSKRCVDFAEVYTEENKDLFTSDNYALYSGVIPRLKQISFTAPSIGNNKVNKMTMSLGRTSYMTIMGLHFTIEGRYIGELLEHPFLDTDVKEGEPSLASINRDFEQCEVKAQNTLKNELENAVDFDEELAAINKYLSLSLNVHNINISGNIITNDGYCIYTKRNNKMTDSNQYYCSVNGGSEINDKSVKYYHNSNEEDIPTISYDTTPVFFGSEMTRESIAELGDTDISPYWDYYGITCMSHFTEDYSKDSNILWAHFNVLGERYSPYSLEQINKMRMHASEKFESKSMYGYSLTEYDSCFKWFESSTLRKLQLIQDNSDIIVAILMALQIIWYKQLNDSVPNTIITIAFGLFAVAISLNKVVTIIQSRKIYKDIIVKTYKRLSVKTYKKNYMDVFNKDFNQKLNAGKDIDAIFYVITNMHVLTTMRNKG